MAAPSSTVVKSSFSSPSPPRWKYDVFLSFRGEDVRKGFLGHLCSNLDQRGLRVFKDDRGLEKGEPIKLELLDAIKASNISVIVFSRNYADSTWCLDELKEIMEWKDKLGQTVLPVFFHVEPSDVRKQAGSFGQAFSRLQEFPQEKVELWKNALTRAANFSGLHLQNDANGDESKLIKRIVREVEGKITPTYPIEDDYLVGIDYTVNEIIARLKLDFGAVLFLGIFGMPGIGKTTIVESIRSKISVKFDGVAFLEDVSGSLEQGLGLIGLQKKLLCGILKQEDVPITDSGTGAMNIKRRLQRKKVLIILDNVDHINHLHALARDQSWFGPGSRIIITCKDEQLLNQIKVDNKYKVGLLSHTDSLRLFSWHAFGKEYPIEGYVELSNDLVNNIEGHPLALKVMGRTLSGFKKDKSQWISACKKLKSISHRDILNQLKKCFDSLEEGEKDVFLDIAIILKGMDVRQAVMILEKLGKHPYFFIPTLKHKCLIGVTKDTLTVHDLLSQMAKEIVRGEAPDDPGQRSRIWYYKDSRQVLRNHKGSTKVKGFLGNFPKRKEDPFDAEAFSNMENLSFLCLSNVEIRGDLDCFSKQLRWLRWDGFSMKYIPHNLCLKKLVVLEMRYSNLERIWNEMKIMKSLKILDLSHSHRLITTSNLSGLISIEKLILEGCIELAEVHESIGSLSELVYLNLRGCKRLRNFSMSLFEPNRLTILDLSSCSSLFSPDKSLRVCTMQSLNSLNLSYCNLSEKSFPRDLEGIANLKILYLRGNKLKRLPIGLTCLQKLGFLDISRCDLSGQERPLVFKTSPKWISLGENKFRTLPIRGLSQCEMLGLYACRYLEEIAGVPDGTNFILRGCVSLKTIAVSRGNVEKRIRLSDVFRKIEDLFALEQFDGKQVMVYGKSTMRVTKIPLQRTKASIRRKWNNCPFQKRKRSHGFLRNKFAHHF